MKIKRNYVPFHTWIDQLIDMHKETDPMIEVAVVWYYSFRYIIHPLMDLLIIQPELKHLNPYSWQERQDFETKYNVTIID